MSVHKPIKRSEQLAPLSRDHHDGLLFVWKLRKGLNNGTPVETIREYIGWFWENHLATHFKNEEEILLPYLSGGDELGTRMKNEHEAIYELIALKEEMAATNIVSLGDLLERHIRFEERELFPHIEKQLTPEQLNAVLSQLGDEQACDTDWKNEFWKN
jgi:hemerythrin-like domain-containing protein